MDIEQFYKDNYRVVYCYLFSLCRDQYTAEDLTSETFLRAIKKIDTYDDRMRPSTWLCTIGRNLYLNQVKKESRRADLEKVILANTDSPEDILIRRENIRQLVQIIEELEEPKRQLFLLRRQGLGYREIAEIMEKTETWARVTYYRVKESVLQRLEENT